MEAINKVLYNVDQTADTTAGTQHGPVQWRLAGNGGRGLHRR